MGSKNSGKATGSPLTCCVAPRSDRRRPSGNGAALPAAELADVLGSRRAFGLRFERCGRLPDVLHLVPEPDTQLRQLTEAIAGHWPEAPPYGGRFADIVPHLTIAQGQEDAVMAEIEADLSGELPFTSRVSSVELIVHDGTTWRERASFALGE
ncbi:2'-5' RNA ligase family protein [Streptomyces sp. NPDC056470]|uniref:2'-5' RNA ligase family protein n=1 Tax=unclassified Streptomyces TaxID=2593676 RepID=UPI0036A3D8E4